MWIITAILCGLFYALSGASLWFAIQCLIVYFHGVNLYWMGCASLLIVALAFFLAGDWCWQKTKWLYEWE